jgi:hypothetical protein
MASRFERLHQDLLKGTLTTVDRLIIHGHLSRLWFPNHMAYLLDRLGVQIVRDFGRFMKEASSQVIAQAEALARKAGRPFIYQDRVVKGKDELARQIGVRDGVTQGLSASSRRWSRRCALPWPAGRSARDCVSAFTCTST